MFFFVFHGGIVQRVKDILNLQLLSRLLRATSFSLWKSPRVRGIIPLFLFFFSRLEFTGFIFSVHFKEDQFFFPTPQCCFSRFQRDFFFWMWIVSVEEFYFQTRGTSSMIGSANLIGQGSWIFFLLFFRSWLKRNFRWIRVNFFIPFKSIHEHGCFNFCL